MADIFISYASDDRNRVRPLADALQKRGFKVWWDRELAAGQDYTAVIERELAAAKAVVVVWTVASAASSYVRDEAGRARDEGRLAPVMLDKINIPLGFGAFQAEDFTKWNGAASAPQMEILDEALRARIEGRDVDGAKIATKRRRLMARVRVVSLLTVVFLVVGIAAAGKYFIRGGQPVATVTQVDPRAQLLQLLAEGKLTPEQAIQLAQLLQAGALGATTQTASADGAAPAAAEGARSAAVAPEAAPADEAAFEQAAQQTYTTAMAQLLRHPDAQVREAAVGLADPATRTNAIQTLWNYAQAHPEGAQAIYEACGVVGEAHGDPLAQRALERAATLTPDNPNNWRLLSRSYRRGNDDQRAQAAALVSDGVAAQANGETATAEQSLQQALPALQQPSARAFVASRLGAIAEQRQDFTAASARYAEAYRASEQAAQTAPDSPAAQQLQDTAQNLVQALDRSGRTREACTQLQEAQVNHDVDAPNADLVNRCRTRFRVQLRPWAQRAQGAAATTATTTATTTAAP